MRGVGAARAVLAALVVATAATAAAAGDAEPLDDEVESAPFAVVVEHSSGWRCGGALVSLRTVLTSAACARGREDAPPAELWARAPQVAAADGARRIARIAVATDMDTQGMEESEQRVEEGWLGAALDMALLELEAPFGPAARVRPILMAAAAEECAGRDACDVVRTPPASSAPLRLAAAQRAPPVVCAARAPHFTAIQDKVLCFTGPQFCPSDWGVGVVCAGKLCGVLSRSARSDASAAPEGCGDTHVAQLVPAWRAFVHCAQTLRSCGRDSCAAVCSERQLLTESKPSYVGLDGGGGDRGGAEGAGGGRRGGDGEEARDRGGGGEGARDRGGGDFLIDLYFHTPQVLSGTTDERTSMGESSTAWPSAGWRRVSPVLPTRTTRPPATSAPPAPPAQYSPPSSVRVAPFEFEPNRADFKMGEYGDNAANYDSGEEVPTRSTPAVTAGARRAAEALLVVPDTASIQSVHNATEATPNAAPDAAPDAASDAASDLTADLLTDTRRQAQPMSSSAVNILPRFLNILVPFFIVFTWLFIDDF